MIRFATKDDYAHVNSLLYERYGLLDPPEDFEFKVEMRRIIVCERDGDIVGFAEVVPTGNSLTITFLVPPENAEDLKELLDAVVDYARELDKEFVIVNTVHDSIPMFEGLGFEKLDWDGIQLHVKMRKRTQ